jgi:hypothetical protein
MINNSIVKNHWVIIVALVMFVIAWTAAFALEEPGLSKIVFYVARYDVGKAAGTFRGVISEE